MPSFLHSLGELQDSEKASLSSWLTKLEPREHKIALAKLSKATPEDLRVILSIPEESRISLFTSKDERREAGKQIASDLAKLSQRMTERNARAREGWKPSKRFMIGFLIICGILITIPFIAALWNML